MPIVIDPVIRDDVKKQRLRQIMIRYCELSFDKMAHEANGLTDAVAFVQVEMDKAQKAYETIENS